MESYLLLFLLVLGINLMPAFGPPTWTILVLFGLNSEMSLPAIVLMGAGGAAIGRFLLGTSFRLLAHRLSRKSRDNLAAARAALEAKRRNLVIALGLFAVSPIPSAQLFEAAGLAGVRLLPFTAAFFAGRILSYAIYVATARQVRETSLGEAFARSFSSPAGIALQLLLLAGLVLLTRLDWARLLARRPQRPD